MARQEYDDLLERLLGGEADLLTALNTLPPVSMAARMTEEDIVREASAIEKAGAAEVIIERMVQIGEESEKKKDYIIKTFDGRVRMQLKIDNLFAGLSFGLSSDIHFNKDFNRVAFEDLPQMLFPGVALPALPQLYDMTSADVDFERPEENGGKKFQSLPLGQKWGLDAYREALADPRKLSSILVDVNNWREPNKFRYRMFMQNADVLHSIPRVRIDIPLADSWNEQTIGWGIDNHHRNYIERGTLGPAPEGLVSAVTAGVNELVRR